MDNSVCVLCDRSLKESAFEESRRVYIAEEVPPVSGGVDAVDLLLEWRDERCEADRR